MLFRTVTISGISTTTKFACDVSGASIGIDAHVNPLWAELDGSGNITNRSRLGDAVGERLARTGTGGTAWLLTDRLGSLREVLDSSGVRVNTIRYHAFGNVRSETNNSWTGNFTFVFPDQCDREATRPPYRSAKQTTP